MATVSTRGRWRAVGAFVPFVLLGTGPLSAQVTATVEITVRAHSGPTVAASTEGVARPSAEIRLLSSAAVSVPEYGITTATNASGVARLRGLQPGRTSIRVTALGFEDAEIELVAINGRVVRADVLLTPAPIHLAGMRVTADADLTAGGIALDVAELPSTVVDLPDAIESVPGATIVRQGGPGAPATVQLRGSGGDQVLVLLDGVSINSPLTGVADLSTVDLSSIDRVVVLPGAQSSRFGARALGGVVLLESRDVTRSSFRGSVGSGAWGFREGDARGTWAPNRSWSFSAGLRRARADGDFVYELPEFRGGGESERGNADFRRIGGDVRVTRSGRWAFSGRFNASDVERGSPGTIAQPSLTAEQRHRRWGVGTTLTRDDAERGGTLRGTVQWQRAEYRDLSPPFGAAYDTRNDVRRGEAGMDGWWRGSVGTASAGTDLSRMTVRSNVLDSESVEVAEFGVWTRLERSQAFGSALSVDLGAALRLDRHELVDGTIASPSIDLSTRAGPMEVELTWGRGFAPPGLADLFFQEGVLVEPNPDLRPERIRNEVSGTVTARAAPGTSELSVRATGYRADVDDMILWFPDFRFIWSPNNFDVQRRGLELGADIGLGVLGGRHTLSADVAWSRVEYTGEVLSGQVVYRPDVSADASLTLDLPLVSITPTAGWIGERRTVAGSELNTLPPYWLIDVGLAFPFDVGAVSGRLDITLSNLLDERAALLVDYPLPSRGWSTRLRLLHG